MNKTNNTHSPTFSVLISVYAQEQSDFMQQCLESLCQQTLPANEIVIVFDGKLPCKFEQTILSFQAALPLKIIRLPENIGLAKALNEGIQHCSNEWIFRMDSDDIALSQRFEWQCHYIEQHPQISLLGGQISEFSGSLEQITSQRKVPLNLPEISQFSKKRNPFNHMTVAYKKSAVLAVGNYQQHCYMEDYNLWLRMLAQGFQAANLPETLVYARTGNNMLKRRRGWQYIKSEWQLSCLKRNLHIQSTLASLYYFLLRAIPRLLPIAILKKIYQSNR